MCEVLTMNQSTRLSAYEYVRASNLLAEHRCFSLPSGGSKLGALIPWVDLSGGLIQFVYSVHRWSTRVCSSDASLGLKQRQRTAGRRLPMHLQRQRGRRRAAVQRNVYVGFVEENPWNTCQNPREPKN